MALSPGARVGGFEILARIGAGGMGEVYRARDTRLGRDVALKVLPETFARDPERLARFDREARTLAALNHPHIAQLHGLEESAGVTALVMELVEGEDLAQRIARGAIPPDEALPIATQIAEALEAAHEAGIIHRDLKPSNIKVRPDGTVKVLDFGLAKALDPSPAAVGAADPANSPTITSPAHLRQGFGEAGTVHGVILGTAAYMAPEQARGKAVDRRADIWAFGCVLYEMLTGVPAFSGETTGDVISAVLRAEPARSARLDRLPPRLRELLDRCLQKDPRARWQHMGDVRVELQRLGSQPEPDLDARARRLPARHALIGAIAGLVVVAAGALLMFAGGWRPSAGAPGGLDARTVRFSFALPPVSEYADWELSHLAISPDGRRIAYTADGRLFVRAIDAIESIAIPHAGRARNPFFSPDGSSLGFHANGRLQRVSLAGGAPLAITAVAEVAGASWGPDDTIIFGSSVGSGLQRVPAAGGPVTTLTKPEPGEVSHGMPHFLPDGRHVVFAIGTGGGSRLAVLSLADGQRRDLLPGGTPHYLASGHLLFSEEGNLRVVPFDGTTAKATGPVSPAVDGTVVWVSLAGLEGTWFAASRAGDLVYVGGASDRATTAPVWVDRTGRETPIPVPTGLYVGPSISSDGRYVGFSRLAQNGVGQVWILDLARGRMFPIASQGADYNPTWTPDNPGRLTYTSNGDLYETLIGRQDPPVPLLARAYYEFPTAWSPDGRVLAFMEIMPTRTELWTMTRGQPPARLFDSTANSGSGTFSPAGGWLAYVSDETGEREVYLRRFPGTERGIQVSVDGGDEPVWSRDGRELFYRRGNSFMAVTVTMGPELRVGQPVELWRRAYWAQDFLRPSYDVAADGRFLVLKRTDASAGMTRHVTVALNWVEELRQGGSAR